jgi:hypothetical protein
LVKAEDRIKKLTQENQQLVDRWLQKVSEEAEKMNVANQLYESMVEKNKQHEVQKKIEDEIKKQQLASAINDDIGILAKMEAYVYQ